MTSFLQRRNMSQLHGFQKLPEEVNFSHDGLLDWFVQVSLQRWYECCLILNKHPGRFQFYSCISSFKFSNLSTAFSCSFLHSTLFVLPVVPKFKGNQVNVKYLHWETAQWGRVRQYSPELKAFLTSATNFVYSPILIYMFYFFSSFYSSLWCKWFGSGCLKVEACEVAVLVITLQVEITHCAHCYQPIAYLTWDVKDNDAKMNIPLLCSEDL